VFFRPNNLGGGCLFELTKNYPGNDRLKDFGIDNALKGGLVCSGEEIGGIQGDYTLSVRGFKISKGYIKNYDPNVSLDSVAMSYYKFYIDYDKIVSTQEPAHLFCNTSLY